MIRRLVSRAVNAYNSDSTTVFLATFAVGWGLQQLTEMLRDRQNAVAELDAAIADRRADLDALGRRCAQLAEDLGDADRVPGTYPAREDLNPLSADPI